MNAQCITANKRNCLTKLYLDNKVEGWQYTPVCKTLVKPGPSAWPAVEPVQAREGIKMQRACRKKYLTWAYSNNFIILASEMY